ncbi:Dam family site-specific DNA-(adenine-N6)-methyltransferase [Parasalinivibrio latis]|uniref:Dam family site-specific DNA-(adenine-N6)-methyltransferase n=1 Tax=Parasalinivibrio latis TaxID=2952610 RepID=UPI0030E3C557
MKKQRAFLKWAGGKYSLVDAIRQHLPEGEELIEPFVGAGSVFLNTDYSSYRLSDINQDLINMFNILKDDASPFIVDARTLFTEHHNVKDKYLSIRKAFNASHDVYERSLFFLYMNRHGYNGLCRYNKKGGYNVPFGSYKKPYFPQAELEFFSEKSQKATFVCESFEQSFAAAREGCVVYCDPPYAPLSATANFTTYSANGFGPGEQKKLGELAVYTAHDKGVPVLISNHDTAQTRDWYQDARLTVVKVKRTISRNVHGRNKVDELLALFSPRF